jgi:hypothetical protein
MDAEVKTVDVYYPAGAVDHLMFVTPAAHTDASCFREPNGTPIQFKIKFVAGKANVPENLADYLIDQEMVEIDPPKRSSIIRAQTVLPEDRVRRPMRVFDRPMAQ